MTSHNATSPEVVEQMIDLWFERKSITEISKATGKCRRTVSRYVSHIPVERIEKSLLLQGWDR